MISCARAADWLNEAVKTMTSGASTAFDAAWGFVKSILMVLTGGLSGWVEIIYDN